MSEKKRILVFKANRCPQCGTVHPEITRLQAENERLKGYWDTATAELARLLRLVDARQPVVDAAVAWASVDGDRLKTQRDLFHAVRAYCASSPQDSHADPPHEDKAWDASSDYRAEAPQDKNKVTE